MSSNKARAKPATAPSKKNALTPPPKKDLENKTPVASTKKQPAPVAKTVDDAVVKTQAPKTFFARHRAKIFCATILAAVIIVLVAIPASVLVKSGSATPYLSNQTFVFASTLPTSYFSTTDKATAFISAVCSPGNLPIDYITSFELADSVQVNQTYYVTEIILQFSSWNMSSNTFRDTVRKYLPTGYLSKYGIVGFGEGFQNPWNFCPNNTYGASCTQCKTCSGALVCDDGTLGTGTCKCPQVFMDGSLFPYQGARVASGRCVTVSKQYLSYDVDVISTPTVVESVTFTNIGNTSESFNGATVVTAANMSLLTQNFYSVTNPTSWPNVLSPGQSFSVSVQVQPSDPGNFWANLLVFIVDDPTSSWLDATAAIPIEITATIAGQVPTSGEIQGQFALYRINAGSTQSGTLNGNSFGPDAWFGSATGVGATASQSDVLNTYRTVGSSASHPVYTFPMKYTGDALVNVILKDDISTAAGQNTFNILINNVAVTTAPIDVYATLAASGSSYLNLSFSYPLYAGSSFTVDFQATAGTAFVSAIEILQTLNVSVSDFTLVSGGADVNYAEALHKSFLFYESLRSGPISTPRLAWRQSSCQECVGPNGEDLSAGYYEAGGNYMKINFPMAWSIGSIAIGMLEHSDGFKSANNWDYALQYLKIATDYFVNCYISDTKIVLSIGKAIGNDFNYYGPPELYHQYVSYRPVWYLTPDPQNRSSELCGEAAALLAVASMVYKSIDATYSNTLLTYAQKYYNFGKSYPGSYKQGTGVGFVEMQMLYPSNNYNDEMAWGALWLYRATGNAQYLSDARSYYDIYQSSGAGCGFAYSWEEKGPALHVYMSYVDTADASRYGKYMQNAQCYFNNWLPGSYRTVPYTPRGLAYPIAWGSIRYALNTAYLAVLYAKFLTKQGYVSNNDLQGRLIQFAKNQTDYVLGASGRSYVAGLGTIYPTYIEHKASYNSILYFPTRHITMYQAQQEYLSSKYPQVHIPYGGVVGGPIPINNEPSDFFIDNRQQYQYVETALDYNACYTSLVAALNQMYPGTPITDSSLLLGFNFTAPRP